MPLGMFREVNRPSRGFTKRHRMLGWPREYPERDEAGDTTRICCYFIGEGLGDRYYRRVAIYSINNAIIFVQWLKMRLLLEIYSFSKIPGRGGSW